jgi:hypothetical protein
VRRIRCSTSEGSNVSTKRRLYPVGASASRSSTIAPFEQTMYSGWMPRRSTIGRVSATERPVEGMTT